MNSAQTVSRRRRGPETPPKIWDWPREVDALRVLAAPLGQGTILQQVLSKTIRL